MPDEFEDWHLYGKSGPPEGSSFREVWLRNDDRAAMLMWQRDASSPEEWTAAIYRPGEAKTLYCYWNDSGRLFHPMPTPNPPPKPSLMPPLTTFAGAVAYHAAVRQEREGRIFPSRETCRVYIETICPFEMN